MSVQNSNVVKKSKNARLYSYVTKEVKNWVVKKATEKETSEADFIFKLIEKAYLKENGKK